LLKARSTMRRILPRRPSIRLRSSFCDPSSP
jgi:hypothetical protein